MKTLPLIVFTLFCSVLLTAQSYQPGYFITPDGEKVDCLINNENWRNNPDDFDYKLSETGVVQTGTMASAKEFGVPGIFKYVLFNGEIDRSSDELKALDTKAEPDFEVEQLFLAVLTEGEVTLFEYTDGTLRRYFFSTPTQPITQLVYKKYRKVKSDVVDWKKGPDVGHNNTFRNQLWKHLSCKDYSIKEVGSLDYKKDDLIDFFEKYYKCSGEKWSNYDEKRMKPKLQLNLRPGLTYSSLSTNNVNSDLRDLDFESKLNFRFGLELEYILPFQNGRWAILLEPAFRTYEASTIKSIGTRMENITARYNSIEIPVGIRHYFPISESSKIFVNASYLFDFDFDEKIDFESLEDLIIEPRGSLVFGVGYKYDRFSLEGRYGLNRDILGTYSTWESSYKNVTVIVGYSIF